MQEEEVKTEAPKEEPSFLPFGKRITVARKAPDVGGFKLTKELERECNPDIGTILQVGQIGFWNKWIRGIRPGRQVHFVRYQPVKIETPEYEYIYLEIDHILAISK